MVLQDWAPFPRQQLRWNPTWAAAAKHTAAQGPETTLEVHVVRATGNLKTIKTEFLKQKPRE